MTVRVRRAASMSMPARSRRAGGTISRSLLSGSQRTRTPIEVSTSMIRLTSSMRARLRSVVRPLLSRLAHSRATAAFLLVLTGIDAGQLAPADDPQVLRAAVAQRDELAVELLADPGEHLEREVLLALLDAGDGALAGAEQVGQLALGQALVASGVPDQRADPGQVGVGRGGDSHRTRVYHL